MDISIELLAARFKQDLLEAEEGKIVIVPKKLPPSVVEEVKAEVALLRGESSTSPAEKRKATPVYSGVLKYFPDALLYLSQVSKAGNDQHNPGKPLHWDRSKSGDELDALTRHLIDHAKNPVDDDGLLHLAKVFWRSGAALQKLLEDLEEFND